MPSNPPGYMRKYYAERAAWFSAYFSYRRVRNQAANAEHMKTARSARLWAGLRQEDVAKCMGVSKACYSDYETGATAYPLPTILRAIAYLAGVSVEELLEESKGYDRPLGRTRAANDRPYRMGRQIAGATVCRQIAGATGGTGDPSPTTKRKAAGAVAAAPTAGCSEVSGRQSAVPTGHLHDNTF